MSKDKNELYFPPPLGNDPLEDRGEALHHEIKHEIYDDKIRADIAQAKRDAEPDEDEKRRRSGRSAGDASPAFATLAHNIRPDVEDSPAGFAVVTTAKSADYRATREEAQPIEPQEPEAHARAVARRQADDESARRQETERRIRSGESVSEHDAAGAPSLRESIAAAAKAAREERGEAEHSETETHERGPHGATRDGGARGGGGGRGR